MSELRPGNGKPSTNKAKPRGPTVFFMRIAYLDCFSGISGDMFLGALVDAGVSAKLLEDTVAALDIGARLEISRVMRSGISATKVDVYAHGEKDVPREVFQAQREHEHAGMVTTIRKNILTNTAKAIMRRRVANTLMKNPTPMRMMIRATGTGAV